MKNLALRFLAAVLAFCFGLTCTFLYRDYIAHRQLRLLMERENKLKSELLMQQHEIDSLLNKFLPVEQTEGDHKVIECADREARYVKEELLRIANRSPQARSQVIETLIRTVEKGPAAEECIIAERWTAAVYMLGDLKATEAIDVLARNLNETGTGPITISLSYHPVTTAVVKIGKPAVPRLIEVLAEKNPWTRSLAAETLAGIGQPALPKLKEALYNGNAETKNGAALALFWIGPEGQAIIDRAIEVETNPEALGKLKDPIKEWWRSWGR